MAESDKRPLVVVTGPAKRLKFGWWATRIQLKRAGLRGHYVTAKNPELPDDACGVIIGGGDDIDPKHYGVSGTAGVNYDAARDQLEMETIRVALERQWPMLGICRGAQLINVVHGGDLHTDIRPLRKLTPNRNSLFPVKQAYLNADSKLAEIYQSKVFKINSLHSQAVKRVGEGLKAVAQDKDGFIQAIENPNKPFLIGVQWHPEYLLFSPEQRKLFNAFAQQVEQCVASTQTT
ncbi:gamma-glutamyl-gamma-aminobutyrate hydrolase family protein [Arenicella xantha]|uniref:Putative glutamine amidotransferase n=1 Tax=Arenicella xantha TaxID=644221 RepID=A0A395JIE8_9GAMM|nr:type 1 glutamine amidotransferase [Arenicella xantha]RBP48717.1 putative glutamine amidotransferase [Arenicella xantha]